MKHPVSEPMLEYARMLALLGSPKATLDCVVSFSATDFRADLPKVQVPTLIIHGSSDQTVPIEASGNRTAQMIPQAQYIVYEGAPHGFYYTEKDRLNQDLLSFISQTAPKTASSAVSN
ncbi:alpha/beta fold hydrolase [Rhodocytophaga aerolata]|uniref:alpha/beta fold hydrolase n=1 Tax=Rhodocytophaga aerolata TaxID=455078 RepID=UPI003458ACBA